MAGQQEEAEELEPAPADVAEEACGCDSSSDGDEEDSGSCEYAAWVLPLLAGQNMFNVTVVAPANSSADGSDEGGGGDEAALEEHHASLAVVRLADPDHAELQSLTGVRSSWVAAAADCCLPSSGQERAPFAGTWFR